MTLRPTRTRLGPSASSFRMRPAPLKSARSLRDFDRAKVRAPSTGLVVASMSWWNDGEPAQVISVMEGVVTLPSAAEAQALFATFPDQWQHCKDRTTTEQTGPISTSTVINDIRVTDSVVAAMNTATATLPNMPDLQPTPQSRAIGVRLNCIVEVEMVFFGDRRPSDPGSANPDTSAVDVAQAMMDKVIELS